MEKYIYKSTTFDHMEKSLKSQLKAMDIVKLENGLIGFISYNECNESGLAIYSPRYQGCLVYLNKYNDDLSSKIKDEHNIIAIYRGPKSYCVLEDLFSDVDFEEIEQYTLNKEWDIKINHFKEITKSEIEEILGYKIKIVDEVEDKI